MILERVTQRVLAAVQLTDAESTAPVARRLRVVATRVVVWRNALGDYVIVSAPGLDAFEASSDPPPTPPAVTHVFTVSDPSGWYLSRKFALDLPANPAVPAAGSPLPANSVFTRSNKTMYPSVAAAASTGSAALYVSVVDGNGNGRAGALIHVVEPSSTTAPLAKGLTDSRGQALVPVPGIRWSAGSTALPASSTTVDIVVYFDKSSTNQSPYVPDPDDLESRLPQLATATADNQTLVSGQPFSISIAIP